MLVEVIFAVVIVWAIWTNVKKPSNYPPGPWGLPFVGHLPLRMSTLEAQLTKLRKEHGDIFSWRIGAKLYVFLCEFKITREAFQRLEFANRPLSITTSLLEEGSKIGVAATNGIQWHNIRRFILRHLRDLGMGKSKLETAIQYEALELVKVMKNQAGRAAQIPKAVTPAVINVLWQMVASKRYELNDEKLIQFDKLLHDFQENLQGALILDVFPWLNNVVPNILLNWIAKTDARNAVALLLKQRLKTYIDEHVGTVDASNPRDFIDDYLIEMEKQKSDPDSTMSHKDLVGCLADLFLAGLETTTLTICWSILYLANFQDVQDRLHKEIDNVLSNETLVSLEDKLKLPYTEAFIHEVLRYSSLAGYGGMHTVFNDTNLGGYTIPKDSIIMTTIGDIHYDPKYFESPKDFSPERFLNSEGKLEIPKEGFFPFGIGKRQCLGESLARMELFIFLTTMLQHLKFSAPPGKEFDLRPKDIPLIHMPRVHQEIMITIRK